MATTADIKNGMCIELDGKTFSIVEFLHVKPGKGPAFVRTKLKNLENGRILDKTFSAGERIEPVRVERRPYQFTYEDDMGAHFMHTETFEEITIDKAMIENADLMTDGCNMGVKSLNMYLNQYKAADEVSKDITKRLINLEQKLTEDIRNFL